MGIYERQPTLGLFLPTSEAPARVTKKRIIIYWVLTLVFMVFYYLTSLFVWSGSVELHTLMETIATLIAIAVGVLALMKYYLLPGKLLLLLGAGFWKKKAWLIR